MKPNYAHAIVLDFEATCDDRSRPRPQEIIEFPSVLMSLKSLEIVDEFQAFVRPIHNPKLTEFCESFTSIRQSDVDEAAGFPKVLEDHQRWLEGHGLSEQNALFVTCGDWDLKTMLPAQCLVSDPRVEALSPIYTSWQNIKHAFCDVQKKNKVPGMAGMLKGLGTKLAGHHHRGIDDCRNIAALYRELIGKGATIGVTAQLQESKHPRITIRRST